MKKSDMKVGATIISPLMYLWQVVRYYSPDMWLIRNEDKKVCILSRGQLRFWERRT